MFIAYLVFYFVKLMEQNTKDNVNVNIIGILWPKIPLFFVYLPWCLSQYTQG